MARRLKPAALTELVIGRGVGDGLVLHTDLVLQQLNCFLLTLPDSGEGANPDEQALSGHPGCGQTKHTHRLSGNGESEALVFPIHIGVSV